MNRKWKRITAWTMTLLMAISTLSLQDGLSMKASASTLEATIVEDTGYCSDISSYRAKDTSVFYTNYPAKTGYVFAGWYVDQEFETPLDKTITEGEAYAKFVPEEVLSVKTQWQTGLSKNTSEQSEESTSIRFVTTVDSLKYEKIGFKLDIEELKYTTETISNKVYTKLYAVGESGEPEGYTPEMLFGENSHYFKTWTYINIPTKAFDMDIMATPFWITLDGTKVFGKPAVRYVDQGRGETRIGTVYYETLEEAITAANAAVTEGEDVTKLELLRDVVVDKNINITNSVNVTTDRRNRKLIYQLGDSGSAMLQIQADGKNVIFQGISENAQLIFEGTDTVSNKNALVYTPSSSGTVGVTMKYVTMQNANKAGVGGAVVCGAPLTLENCTFSNCTGTQGGAVYATQKTTVSDCTFNNCEATSSSNGGGAVYVTGNLDVKDSTFHACKAGYRGGAIYAAASTTNSVSLQGSTFTENVAGNAGGAVLSTGSNASYPLTVDNCTFENNTATGHMGGAVAFSSQNGKLALSGNCSFNDNKAKGNGIYLGGAVMAPVNVTINDGAEVIMTGNECTGTDAGDAICINTTNVSAVNFQFGENSALYVYDNPDTDDTHNDICIRSGIEVDTSQWSSYHAEAPTVATIGGTSYKSLKDAVDAADEGATITLVRDVVLNNSASAITIRKAITITTDEKSRKIIYQPGTYTGWLLTVNAVDKNVIFKGSSENAQLIFEGTGDTGWSRGLVYLQAAAGVTMENVTMQNAYRMNGNGGAIVNTVDLTLMNCTFTNCKVNGTVSVYGGAIYSYTNGKMTVIDSSFDKCSSGYRGGAIHVTHPITLTNSTFTGNTATNAGGAVCSSTSGVIEINGCTFNGNTSENSFGGAVGFSDEGATLNLSGNCTFNNNHARGMVGSNNRMYYGGAVMAPANFTIKNGAHVEMTGNECTNYMFGDAICINAASADGFKIEAGAALYVYNNPDESDTDNDVCLNNSEAAIPTLADDTSIYSTTTPEGETQP